MLLVFINMQSIVFSFILLFFLFSSLTKSEVTYSYVVYPEDLHCNGGPTFTSFGSDSQCVTLHGGNIIIIIILIMRKLNDP